jgi:uncharacterized membrane protein YjdF
MDKKSERLNKATLWMFIVILIAFEIFAFTVDSHYRYDFILMILLFVTVFKIRDKIRLHPLHFFLLGVLLLLHGFGVFGTYENYYFGLEYDLYVHGFFGLVLALILYRSYNLVGFYRGWFMYVAIIAVVLGFSAMHEINEYVGALVVGDGEGVLGVGAGDLDNWDAQKDMVNNVVGALIGLGLYRFWNLIRGEKGLEQRMKRKRR